MCALGWSTLAHFFPCFFRSEKSPSRNAKCKKNTLFISFCAMRLLSLSSIARVKREAESALESFEELQKELKKSLFDGSAQFSLVV